MNKQRISILNFISILLLAGTSSAQVITNSPILTVTSKTMTVKNQEHIAIFDENVIVSKGDLNIKADHVEITFGYDSSSDNKRDGALQILPNSQFDDRAISKLHAWGNVILQQGTRHAESHEAIYDQKDEKVILLGEPVVFEKGYQVTGTKMTFFLKDNRSIVESSKVLIHPQELREP